MWRPAVAVVGVGEQARGVVGGRRFHVENTF